MSKLAQSSHTGWDHTLIATANIVVKLPSRESQL